MVVLAVDLYHVADGSLLSVNSIHRVLNDAYTYNSGGFIRVSNVKYLLERSPDWSYNDYSAKLNKYG